MPDIRHKVLIVDDDRALLGVLAVRLGDAGYDVASASDSRHAMSQIAAQRPDAVVMDIHMPAGSGFNVLERMYKAPEFKRIPVIYMSGDTSEGVEETARHFGAFALIHKPFEIDELIEALGRALGATGRGGSTGKGVL